MTCTHCSLLPRPDMWPLLCPDLDASLVLIVLSYFGDRDCFLAVASSELPLVMVRCGSCWSLSWKWEGSSRESFSLPSRHMIQKNESHIPSSLPFSSVCLRWARTCPKSVSIFLYPHASSRSHKILLYRRLFTLEQSCPDQSSSSKVNRGITSLWSSPNMWLGHFPSRDI